MDNDVIRYRDVIYLNLVIILNMNIFLEGEDMFDNLQVIFQCACSTYVCAFGFACFLNLELTHSYYFLLLMLIFILMEILIVSISNSYNSNLPHLD
jgi:hypothetical protein